MEKFISLMNSHSIHTLWQTEMGRDYLTELVNYITESDDNYTLIPTFSYETKYLRSYIFLESEKKIILVDFNHRENNIKLNINLELINFLRLTAEKEVLCIIFNNYKGESTMIDGIYNIYHNNKNIDEIKLIYSDNIKNQNKYDKNQITKYLYNLDYNFYELYLKEILKEEKIYN